MGCQHHNADGHERVLHHCRAVYGDSLMANKQTETNSWLAKSACKPAQPRPTPSLVATCSHVQQRRASPLSNIPQVCGPPSCGCACRCARHPVRNQTTTTPPPFAQTAPGNGYGICDFASGGGGVCADSQLEVADVVRQPLWGSSVACRPGGWPWLRLP